MKCRLRAWLLLLVSMPALADVSLPGFQHIGDFDDTSATPSYTPRDPVTRVQMQANPSHFYLSQAATITAVRLDNVADLNNQLQVFVDNAALSGTLSGTCDNGVACTYTLNTPLVLGAGSHTIWPDGGCFPASFALPCGTNENDFAFSGMTLISVQTSTHRSDQRRRHLGDSNDSDDNYGGRWYPDNFDASAADISFSVDASRVLSEVRFWRLRDINGAPLSFPRVLLDGVQIGTLTGNGSPFILSSSAVVAAGAHTLRVEAGQNTAIDLDDISWDDTVLILVNNPATTPGAFNAVDPGGNAASGVIQTRTAGSAANVDLVAVSGGAQFTTYTGTVSVELLDSRNTTGIVTGGTNCDAGWVSLGVLGSATFLAGDVGRQAFSFNYPEALTNARLRITDSALAVTGCSSDAFAIKPSGFAGILVTHATPTTAGTAFSLATSGFTATTTPIHNAGTPFTITATAVNAGGSTTTNYAGSPSLGASASVLGSSTGIASASGWAATATPGQVRSDNAQYFEAGAVTLQLSDTTFAAVDAADGTSLAQRTVGPTSFSVGRFVPDHFKFAQAVPAQFVPACSGGSTPFTYAGQPFSFTNTPSADITAVAYDGTTTTNYDGALYKLVVNPQSTYAALAGTFDNSRVPNPDNSVVNHHNGVTTYTIIPPAGGYAFTKGTTPAVPFDADVVITLRPDALTGKFDSDDVAFDAATPGRFGTAAVDQGIPFAVGGVSNTTYNQVRYGRLVIENTHGSERLPMQVPVRAEYFETVGGGTGFVRNLLDNGSGSAGCTGALLTVGTFTLSAGAAATPGGLSVMDKGQAQLMLNAPNVTEQDTITAQIAGTIPWLQVDDSDADLLWNNNPTGVAAFGLFRNDARRIYQREVIGP